MEIGSAAIHILIDTWEGHLTPTEVATLADRASRGRDHNIVKAAAELALSCLPQAHALNPSEVQRALYQCKEQSKEMLEKACLAVENAAVGGGVYPEVLFHVAKRWYELSEEAASQPGDDHQPRGSGRDSRPHSAPSASAPTSSPAQVDNSAAANVPVMQFSNTSPNAANQVAVSGTQIMPHSGQLPAQALVLPFPIPPVHPANAHHPQHHLPHQQAFVQPTYNFVQQIPQPFAPTYSQSTIPMHPQNMPPYVTLTYNNPIQYNMSQPAYSSAAPYRPVGPAQGVQVLPSQNCQVANIQGLISTQPPLPLPQQPNEDINHSHVLGSSHLLNPTQAHYLHAAFRVGILAMETLARRVHDDRPQTKYARNPPNGDDVKWLLKLAMKLGKLIRSQKHI